MEFGAAPESDAPARAWLAKHAGSFKHYIGGEWREPIGGARFDSIDPSTGALLGKVAQGSAADVDAAVKAARAAYPAWAALSGHARARHLYALARTVQKHSRFLAVLETLDNGKTIRETRDIDVPLVARHFYHHAGWAQLRDAEFPGFTPVGVVGQIIPWNFPLLMMAWKIAPALAAGNTVVLKPAEFTSLTAIAFAELAHEAGLPPGVLNIVTGDGSTGKFLVDHPGVDKIAFTGSTECRQADSARDRWFGEKALARARREEPVHRLRRRGSRQRRGGSRRRDLVQPGTGVLRGIAPARARGNRGRPHAEAARADGEAPRRRAVG